MYGQEVSVADKGFENVRQDFLLYDTVRIGDDVPTNVSGWYTTLTDLAASDSDISFFDVRQESECTPVYTNVKKKTGLDFPVIFTDFGVGFFYPDPVNSEQYDGDRAAAKIFKTALPQHMSCAMYIGGADNKILTSRVEMLPYGFGPSGSQMGGVNMIEYASALTNGIPLAGNRFRFANLPLALPKDIVISFKLSLSKTAKTILNAMANVQPISFENGTWNNECMIVACYRGVRDIQQIGDLRR